MAAIGIDWEIAFKMMSIARYSGHFAYEKIKSQIFII